ncbi:D-aminoacyl-tRNA deacylase 1-like [Stylophora pistillata]|uniref:D-aminoacyl-tRNA deacylase n=1 Tax=Stylophora pistillata TaxID=50429 RepID=A0A2B4RE83_STYPI|nr:D-aminoacyl-tRNA deacylase 1-like [Stylophora pistillata]PFX14585.1 D-tyrosyl-tRNA(Tyr) deacylase 1 [Stylophora pistillata]
MRAIVQRVTQASVSVDGEVISSIGKGLCVLLGISKYDTPKEIEYMVRKILNLRVFDENEQRWKKSVVDKNFEVLCVSQFTLQAVLKGNKPDYHLAMGGEQSKAFYGDFLQAMKSAYKPDAVKDGKFGAYMQVHIQNDGPVTISIETPPPQQVQQKQVKGTSGSTKAATMTVDEGAANSFPNAENHSSLIDAEQQIQEFDDLNVDEKQGRT